MGSSIVFGLDFNSFLTEEADANKEFKAYFSADSPFEFDVNPKHGQIGDGEQQFVVSFCPNEYGAALNGNLMIETATMEWSYRVIGTHPIYKPPNLKQFKPTVDDKISAKIKNKRQNQKKKKKKKKIPRVSTLLKKKKKKKKK